MGLYFTGDCHGNFDRFSDIEFLINIVDYKHSTPERDVIAVAGDFGGVFYPKTVEAWLFKNAECKLDVLERQPFTFVFADGNHENFDRLKDYPEEQRFGGTVGRIRNNIFWLKERGHVYMIEGHSVLVFGGATSFDRWVRTEGKNWWPGECPCDDDYVRCIQELRQHDMKVDYILTHNAPQEAVDYVGDIRATRFRMSMSDYHDLSDPLPAFFQFIAERTLFRRWYFGHFHEDEAFTLQTAYGYRAYRALYKGVAESDVNECGEAECKVDRT